jgi:hypothetical protein
LKEQYQGKKAVGRPRLQYLEQAVRYTEVDNYGTLKGMVLQQIQMERYRPIKGLRDKKKRRRNLK